MGGVDGKGLLFVMSLRVAGVVGAGDSTARACLFSLAKEMSDSLCSRRFS